MTAGHVPRVGARVVSTVMSLRDAARELGLTPRQLAYEIRNGAPVVRPGRRGAGGAVLVDVEAIRAYRASLAPRTAAQNRDTAAGMLRDLADDAAALFRKVSGPHKQELAFRVIEQFLSTGETVHRWLNLPAFGPDDVPMPIRQLVKSTKAAGD